MASRTDKIRQVRTTAGALLVIGGALFAFVLFYTSHEAAPQTQGWVETPCTIVSSRVEALDMMDGVEYEVQIHFRYLYDNKEYESAFHTLGSERSSDREAIEEIVADYRSGLRTTCYVNPQDPNEAVLVRFTHNAARAIGLGFVAIVVGAAVILAQWRGVARR